MKVTIEFENEQDAMQALKAANWQHAFWQLDQELRGIVKHGYIGNREATDCEIDVFTRCRNMLGTLMNHNDITFDL